MQDGQTQKYIAGKQVPFWRGLGDGYGHRNLPRGFIASPM